MKVEKVFYQKAFPIGPFLQEKIGVEIQIDEEFGDKPENVMCIAKAMVETFHKSQHPELYSELPDTEIQPTAPASVDNRIEKLIADIYSCTEMKVLESYRLLAKTKPELQAAYDQMIEKLTPKQ